MESSKKEVEINNPQKLLNCLKDSDTHAVLLNTLKISDEDFIKNGNNSLKCYVYSKIMGILFFYNKRIILKNLITSFDKELLLTKCNSLEYKNKLLN